MDIYSTNLKYMTIAVPPLSDQVNHCERRFLGQAVKDMDGSIYRPERSRRLSWRLSIRAPSDRRCGYR